jgi:hypothetical protein
MTRSEWEEWVRSPITKAVANHLTNVSNDRIESMLNCNAETIEGFGIRHLAYRNQVNGIAEFLDFETLAESLGVPNED